MFARPLYALLAPYGELPTQLTHLGRQLDQLRQPVDHPAEGLSSTPFLPVATVRFAARICNSQSAVVGRSATIAWPASGTAHAGEFAAPQGVRRLASAVLAPQLLHRHDGFCLAQQADDLVFGEAVLYVQAPPAERLDAKPLCYSKAWASRQEWWVDTTETVQFPRGFAHHANAAMFRAQLCMPQGRQCVGELNGYPSAPWRTHSCPRAR